MLDAEPCPSPKIDAIITLILHPDSRVTHQDLRSPWHGGKALQHDCQYPAAWCVKVSPSWIWKARTSYSAVGVCTLRPFPTARVPPIVRFVNIQPLCNISRSPAGVGRPRPFPWKRHGNRPVWPARVAHNALCPAYIPSTARAGGEDLLNSCVHSRCNYAARTISTPFHNSRHALT